MPARHDVKQLTDIPNIGTAIAKTLQRSGIARPCELIGEDPYALFERICSILNTRLDPCFLDTLIAAVDYMNGGVPRKWWEFTAGRKARLDAIEKEASDEQH